jgi:Predicted acetyltransferase
MEFISEENRFYLEDENQILIAEVTFLIKDDTLIINHTFVNPDYRGKQLGQQLIKKVVDKAEAENKKIEPLCSFAQREFEKNEAYQHLKK